MSENTTPRNIERTTADVSNDTSTNLGENEASQESSERTYHHDIAENFIRDHAHDIAPEDRDKLVESVAYEVKRVLNSNQYASKADKVVALEKLILGLKGNQQIAPEVKSTAEEEKKNHETALPVDANDPDKQYDAIEEGAREDGGRVRSSLTARERLGLLTPGGAWASLQAAKAARQARKQEKLDNKLAPMSPEERQAYLENREKRRKRLGIVAAVAIGAAAAGFVASRYAGVDLNPFGDDGSGKEAARAGLGGSGAKSGEHLNAQGADSEGGIDPDSVKPGEHQNLDDLNGHEVELASYSNSDERFYDFANKQFHGDHGTPLVASAEDGDRGAGFADWMNRNKTETNGLGNVAAGLGIDQDGNIITDKNQLAEYQSLNNRNMLADQIDGDASLQRSYDENIRDALENKFNLETITIDRPYTTTLMNDVNGDPVISIKQHVDLGGTAFKATNPETGEVTYWRKECGGYQQIWLEEAAPAPAVGGVGGGIYEGSEGGTTTTPGGEGGGNPPETQPPVTQPPETQPPVTQPPETQPPVTQPPETQPPEKDTSLTPDLDGVTVRPLEGELTQHPDIEGNGTTSEDATVTTETGTTTTEDTGTGVGVEGADTTTNETIDNPVESDMNETDQSGGTVPNGAIDPNKI